MPELKPQTHFLLRGSALLAVLLTLWWFLLLTPMLVLLQGASGAFLQTQETPSGGWTLRMPLNAILPASPERPVAQQIHSIDFDMERSDLIGFTFSLPIFWALMLAAPGLRRNVRGLLLGTAVMAAVELLMLLAFAQIAARNALGAISGVDEATAKWARHLGEYLIVSVIPFVMPFILALSLHRELRTAIFPGVTVGQAPATLPAATGSRGRRRREKL